MCIILNLYKERKKHLLRVNFMLSAVRLDNKPTLVSNPPHPPPHPRAPCLTLWGTWDKSNQHLNWKASFSSVVKWTEMPDDSRALPPPFSSLTCTNIRAGTEGESVCMLCVWQQRAVCVFEESSSLGSGLSRNKDRTMTEYRLCRKEERLIYPLCVCTNLIYRD